MGGLEKEQGTVLRGVESGAPFGRVDVCGASRQPRGGATQAAGCITSLVLR